MFKNTCPRIIQRARQISRVWSSTAGALEAQGPSPVPCLTRALSCEIRPTDSTVCPLQLQRRNSKTLLEAGHLSIWVRWFFVFERCHFLRKFPSQFDVPKNLSIRMDPSWTLSNCPKKKHELYSSIFHIPKEVRDHIYIYISFPLFLAHIFIIYQPFRDPMSHCQTGCLFIAIHWSCWSRCTPISAKSPGPNWGPCEWVCQEFAHDFCIRNGFISNNKHWVSRKLTWHRKLMLKTEFTMIDVENWVANIGIKLTPFLIFNTGCLQKVVETMHACDFWAPRFFPQATLPPPRSCRYGAIWMWWFWKLLSQKNPSKNTIFANQVIKT